MIGQTIESRPSFPVGARAWGGVGAALCLLTLVLQESWPALLSILPWLALVVLLVRLSRHRPFRATFTETGLEVDDPPHTVPYDRMEGLRAGRRPVNPYLAGPRAYPIQLIHPDGVVRFPPQLTVPSDEVYSFLYQKLSSCGSGDVHPDLVAYLRYKQHEYGPSRVWSYRARQYRGQTHAYAELVSMGLAALLAGTVWLLVGIALATPGWIAGGLGALVLGALVTLPFVLGSPLQKVPKILRKASLVICPDGLALVQGDLHGQLRWDEIRDVQVKKNVAETAPQSFQLSSSGGGPGIVIKVAGAAIVIFDIYDRPLPVIHQLITHYRSGAGAPALDWKFDARLLDTAAGDYWSSAVQRGI